MESRDGQSKVDGLSEWRPYSNTSLNMYLTPDTIKWNYQY
jgi:hypothetical protein